MNNDNKSTSCTSSDKQTHADIANYKNVMEVLVFEEIEKKIKQYPKNLSQYINKVEVATYALNRLPSLYASSMEGLSWQKKGPLTTTSKKFVLLFLKDLQQFKEIYLENIIL